MELIGLGAIGLAFSLYLALPGRVRRKRRKELGLDPIERAARHSSWLNDLEDQERIDEDWRNDVPPGYRSGGWTGTRYYGIRRRP